MERKNLLESISAKTKMLRSKKGFSGVLAGVITISVIFVVLAVILYVMTVLGDSFTANSAAANATTSAITQLSAGIPLIGLLFIVVILAAVIAYLLGAFGGGRGGAKA